MDPRRLLNGRRLAVPLPALACAGLLLPGCASLRELAAGRTAAAPAVQPHAPPAVASDDAAAPRFATMAPIPDAPEPGPAPAAVRRTPSPAPSGPAAIAAANREARETSRAEAFLGGLQVFAYEPGRVFEVWTAPLRVTTLTLAPGEIIVSKAAGDTVRWQIGETASGTGGARRAHVMIKPLERGLETNLVLATSQRIYLVQLRSGPPETFNAAVAWDLAAAVMPAAGAEAPPARGPDPLVTPAGPLDASYRIEARGRAPAWAPAAVMTDGVRTFLRFPPELASREAPALFVLGPGGETQLVNYRQQGGLWVVDRVFDRAELRAGDRRRQVVRIVRVGGRS